MRAVVSLLVFLVVFGVSALFTVQNWLRTSVLSLNLGPAGAWTSAEAWPIPVLMLAAFALGALLGSLPVLIASFRKSARIRELERQIAANGF